MFSTGINAKSISRIANMKALYDLDFSKGFGIQNYANNTLLGAIGSTEVANLCGNTDYNLVCDFNSFAANGETEFNNKIYKPTLKADGTGLAGKNFIDFTKTATTSGSSLAPKNAIEMFGSGDTGGTMFFAATSPFIYTPFIIALSNQLWTTASTTPYLTYHNNYNYLTTYFRTATIYIVVVRWNYGSYTKNNFNYYNVNSPQIASADTSVRNIRNIGSAGTTYADYGGWGIKRTISFNSAMHPNMPAAQSYIWNNSHIGGWGSMKMYNFGFANRSLNDEETTNILNYLYRKFNI